MDGIHDLGGMEGFGPVPVAEGDHDFAQIEEWEQRMWALARAGIAKGITIDWFRHGLERMVPSDYLSFAYFNKWCANYFMLLLDNGTITREEIARGPAEARVTAEALGLPEVLERNAGGAASFAIDPDAAPAFVPGDRVRTARRQHAGHTRLPRYARDRVGRVIAHHGGHAFPDEGAKGNHVGQHLYTVAFTASELWGEGANPRDSVTLELWESYLVPA